MQLKCTVNTPSISKITQDCPRKDRPMIVIWNKQVDKGVNMGSDGEYVMMPKTLFYELIKK